MSRGTVKERRGHWFCLHEHCCPSYPTPRFSSPTDCLPEGQLEELVQEIRAANEFLLNLALDDSRSRNEIYYKLFKRLEGMQVDIATASDGRRGGTVKLAGADFVSLIEVKEERVLPYGQVKTIFHVGILEDCHTKQESLDFSPCMRRDVTFRFGETVASPPVLMQRFFKLPLWMYLFFLIGSEVRINADDLHFEGTLIDVDQYIITVEYGEDIIDFTNDGLVSLVIVD